MKKITITLLIIFSAVFTQAQITITNSDFAPAGTTIVQINDTMPDASIVPGNPGSNKSWDFSALHKNTYDTIFAELPSATPYGDKFPDANYTLKRITNNDTMYAYMIKNEDVLSNIGIAGTMGDSSTPIAFDIIPQNIIIDFPMQYGNHSDENYYYEITVVSPAPGPDSIKMKYSTVKTVDVDAWGNITIPSGTYNTLRTKTVSFETDSTWILMFGVWNFIMSDTSTTVSYDWYTNEVSPGFTLMSMDYNDSVVSNVTFLNGVPVGIKQNKLNTIAIYPNPAKEIVVFRLNEYVNGNMNIYNNLGRKILEKKINGNIFKINVAGFLSGNYFVVINDNTNSKLQYSGKFIKE